MTKKITDKLNEIFSIQKPLNFDHQFWDSFETTVEYCKQSGYSFIYYSFDSDIFEQFKETANADEVETIEALNYQIIQCEDNIKQDKLFNQTKEYQDFIFSYLTDLKRERDFIFADLSGEKSFKKIDEQTIQYSSCINSVYDFKIKYYINTPWQQKTI